MGFRWLRNAFDIWEEGGIESNALVAGKRGKERKPYLNIRPDSSFDDWHCCWRCEWKIGSLVVEVSCELAM